METTLDIQDELLLQARRHARRTGQPLRAVVEEGLLRVLPAATPRAAYRLPDLSVGRTGEADPLEAYSWQDLREIVYGEPETP